MKDLGFTFILSNCWGLELAGVVEMSIGWKSSESMIHAVPRICNVHSAGPKPDRPCCYCLKTNHVIGDCEAWKQRQWLGAKQRKKKFFMTFAPPKVVQTDQGTNFLSKVLSKQRSLYLSLDVQCLPSGIAGHGKRRRLISCSRGREGGG